MARPDNSTIKRSLSKRFPATSFRVFSGRGTSSSWTHIAWQDGPSEQLVTAHVSSIGARPGYMDQTDYYNGERMSLTRKISDAFKLRVAVELLGSKPVPPMDVWHYSVKRPNGGGWYDLRDCVWQAIQRRDYLDSCRFDAHAWLEAWAHGLKEAPSAVCYA